MERIAVGLAALGRPAYLNLGRDLPPERDVAAMRAATHAVLDEAYRAGVRWVDVARSYGRSEEFLGDWLAARGHQDVFVSSKWGYRYVGDWRLDAEVHEVKEHSLARFTEQWARTRELLGAQVGLYQVHSLTVDSPLFTDRPLLDALAGLSASGVEVGFSTSGSAQADAMRRAFELEVGGQPVFSAVQSTWNVLEPSAGAALAEARAAGNRVLVKETLANGRLAVAAPEPVRRLAAEHGVGPDAVAVAAVLAQEWVSVAVLGPSSPAQLRANLAAVRVPRAGLAALSGLAEDPREYWAQRSHLRWN
ncbi:aryl-alcohol dehydrogenase-like predicted oxidoreductase [Amycolatopsis sulphurea]|uniref:Aryl-alcohol dehydrogenase-like predicted oxidoreductase n=1 Tax=Amycolatopsis sulphurea TaxID=76022 RepID=A0A2A9G3J6_9PSEU|nr:aldo/keto reductase [Amycolatopsis sulphurea]PFG57432.1 aryl-alcohol dehydrogenase-like predicted oxidoreductase [Amycolatopsis sulphurea]